MNITRKNHTQLGEPVGPYTHCVKFNNQIYTSGLTAFGTDAIDKNIVDQTKEIFKQLDILLKSENSGLNRLIKVTLFVSDITLLSTVRDTLFDLYNSDIPASSAVEVSNLFDPRVKIEIEAIAAVNP
ncbi:MAG: RidA family protein [Saccharospirillaceae bacterium]|nr:RidA family protein [Pseudomonadales bacterium]NRB77458.1 RidA family protein [Saccharospirillaceae bacterium]